MRLSVSEMGKRALIVMQENASSSGGFDRYAVNGAIIASFV